jgi:putative phage-type endonuclease
MEQRTDNWLSWRKRGIGGSDAPIIMGLSPWKTAFQLWEEKTDKVKPDGVSNWAQNRGNELEPIARAKYELEMGFEMGAATCAHYQHDFLRASMDGWNPACPPVMAEIVNRDGARVFENAGVPKVHKRGLEIKCPGEKDHRMAESGHVPEKYFYQLVHQFIVTAADVIDYYSYWVPKGVDDDKGLSCRIEVPRPSNAILMEYFKVAQKFWKCVTEDEAPALTDKDYKKVRSVEIRKDCEEWKRKKLELEKLEFEVDTLKDKIITAIGDDVKRAIVNGAGVKLITVEAKGKVDYKKVPELKGVNLEQYRGKPSVSRQLKPHTEEVASDNEAATV